MLEYYKSQGVDIRKDHDQYSTDLMKCITLAEKLWFAGDDHSSSAEPKQTESTAPGLYAYNVYVLGGLGGRVDQSFHSIHHLHVSNNISIEKVLSTTKDQTLPSEKSTTQPAILKNEQSTKTEPKLSFEPSTSSSLITEDDDYLYLEQRPSLPHTLTLVSFTSLTQANLTFLVPKGRTVIRMNKDYLGPALGILPMLGATELSTRGLVYDVDKWITEFGGKVSTSNYLWSCYDDGSDNEEKEKEEKQNDDHGDSFVTIECNKPVVITVEIRSYEDDDDE